MSRSRGECLEGNERCANECGPLDGFVDEVIHTPGIGVRETGEMEDPSPSCLHKQVREDDLVDQTYAGDAGQGDGAPGAADDETFAEIQILFVNHHRDREDGVSSCKTARGESVWHICVA